MLNTTEVASTGTPENVTPDFRSFLQSELIRRCRVNPRYSLRAFSRLLQLESSYLSKVLQGKRSVTEKLIDRLRTPLALDEASVVKFKSTIRKHRKGSASAEATAKSFHNVSLDSFQVISDWYHYAILELVTVQNFRSDAKWIGRVLDIPVPMVSEAIDRLLRLGMLEKNEQGQFRAPVNHTTVGNNFSHESFRNLQRSVLEMALRALDEIPMEKRDQTSITMAINTDLIPAAKEKLKLFRRELMTFLQQPGPRNAVYQLGMSFYPLTKMSEEAESNVNREGTA